MKYTRFKKSDFEIRGRRSGSQLKGRENEYVYEIFYKDGRQIQNAVFTSKARASKWLSERLSRLNEIMKKVKENGKNDN